MYGGRPGSEQGHCDRRRVSTFWWPPLQHTCTHKTTKQTCLIDVLLCDAQALFSHRLLLSPYYLELLMPSHGGIAAKHTCRHHGEKQSPRRQDAASCFTTENLRRMLVASVARSRRRQRLLHQRRPDYPEAYLLTANSSRMAAKLTTR